SSNTVKVYPVPTAKFSTNEPRCEDEKVDFNGKNSLIPGQSNYTFKWDYDDGLIDSNTRDTNHQYLNDGEYNAQLTIESQFGCKDSTTKTVTVNPVPKADFLTNDTCLGNPISFIDNSQGNGSSIASKKWNLEDTTITNPNSLVNYNYDTAGIRDVKLTVNSGKGCDATESKKVEVFPLPEANFTVNDTGQCRQGNSYQFTDQSSISSGSLNYDWDFGDGDSASKATPTHSYSSQGSYTVEQIVTSDKGCKDTASEVMEVNPMPSPAFSYNEDSSQCLEGNQYSLTNNSTITSGSQNYAWTFGDSSDSTDIDPSYTYSSADTFKIELIATSDSGCVDTTSRKVTVE
ncbi:MAG: hypothetical protein BRD49_02265, partial [Bacteroidetes bacterium SW_10_40_5]